VQDPAQGSSSLTCRLSPDSLRKNHEPRVLDLLPLALRACSESEEISGGVTASSDGGCGSVGWRKGIAWLCCACRVRSAISNGSRSILRAGRDPYTSRVAIFVVLSSYSSRSEQCDSNDTTSTKRFSWDCERTPGRPREPSIAQPRHAARLKRSTKVSTDD